MGNLLGALVLIAPITVLAIAFAGIFWFGFVDKQ